MYLSIRKGMGSAVIAVIVIIVIIVAGVAVYYAATSSSSSTTTTTTTTSSTAGPPKQYKVVLIGASVASDYFAEYFQLGADAAAKALSTSTLQITMTQAFSVSTSQVISVCQQYASEGYNLIELYVDYDGMYQQIAQAVPGVQFIDEYNYPNNYNATTFNYQNPDSNLYTYNATNMVGYDVNLYGSYYVSGVAAALVTKTGAVGFEGAFNIPAIAEWYNDFALGVHSINPSMKVYYTFTNDWSDATKGAAATDSLVSEGSGVVSTAGDSQSIGAAKEAVSKGVFGIAYPTNLNNLSSSYMLGSVYFNSTRLWMDILTDAVGNNLAGHYYNIDFSHGGTTFVVNPSLVSSGIVTSSMMTQINSAAQGLDSYTLNLPFDGAFPAEPS